jgi:hypothetical protein
MEVVVSRNNVRRNQIQEMLGTFMFWGNLREGGLLEDAGVDGRIILKWIFERLDWGGGGIGWIDRAQYRGRWQAVVNTVMTLWVP